MEKTRQELIVELYATNLTPEQSMLVTLLLGNDPKAKRKAPETALPDDWVPTVAHYEWARQHAKGQDWVSGIAEDMRNWAKSKGEHRASWDRTFSTFMKRDIKPKPVQQHVWVDKRSQRIGGGYA